VDGFGAAEFFECSFGKDTTLSTALRKRDAVGALLTKGRRAAVNRIHFLCKAL
jgi:hypothetical protein